MFLQLIPSKEGPVAQIAISADERMLGVATMRGTVRKNSSQSLEDFK